MQDVHDGEILTLSFSLLSKNDFSSEDGMDGHYFLASGGRDRTIHLYDVKRFTSQLLHLLLAHIMCILFLHFLSGILTSLKLLMTILLL